MGDVPTGATLFDVALAALVTINTLLIAWGNYQRTKQNREIKRSIDGGSPTAEDPR